MAPIYGYCHKLRQLATGAQTPLKETINNTRRVSKNAQLRGLTNRRMINNLDAISIGIIHIE